jgi:hypothetical protein
MLKARYRINWTIPMRRPSKFKKTDVKRAARAVIEAGLQIARIEVARDGAISVIPGKPKEACDDDETPEGVMKLL